MPRRKPVPIPDGGFRNIAVLRLSSLGDVVLTLPVVHALARAFPSARLAYWTKEEYRDALRSEPAIAHVRVLERDARKVEDLVSMGAELEECDLIVDLHGNLRTKILTWRQKAPVLIAPSYRVLRERWVRARWTRPRPAPHALARYADAVAPIGVTVEGAPRMEAGEEAERWASEWMSAWSPASPPLALCPGARHFTKRWPETRWLELHEALSKAGRNLLFFSLDSERRAMPRLAAAVAKGATARWCVEPLPRMAALLSRCAAAVTSDSGLMHVAAARGLRVVALFGSTVPEFGFTPVGEGHVVLCRHEPCQPCTLHGRESCPKKHFRCMTEIRAETVLESVARIDAAPNAVTAR